MMSFRWVLVCCALALFVPTNTARVAAATIAGTVISNTATLALTDGNGTVTTVVSNTVSATVAAVSGVVVGPKETGCNPAADAFPAGVPVSRTFAVTNASNIPDAYTIVASTSAGTIASLSSGGSSAPSPFTNGATTPVLQPGASFVVTVTVATPNVAIGSNVSISLAATSTAASAANGKATDSAQQCAIAASSAKLAGPGGANTPIVKLVDNAAFEATQAGSKITYAIKFTNYGGTPALDVVVTDDVPAGVVPTLASVAVNGMATSNATLARQHLAIRVGTLAANAATIVTFDATIESTMPVGKTIVNTANVSADNAPAATTTQASVLVGIANVVYDGYVGASAPIGGATVTLVDPKTNAPLALIGAGGIAPNGGNADPFVTGSDGKYSFALTPQQLGFVAGAAPVSKTFVLTIRDAGFLNRRIQIVLTPNADGSLYSAVVTSLDGEPLAKGGGFALTTEPVTLASIFGLFGNLPIFRAQSIAIVKNVDRTFAASGDRLLYTVTFSNVGTPLGPTSIVDTLPVGVAYAPGSSLVDGVRAEPARAGRTLTYALPTLEAGGTITYVAVILPGVPENSVLTNNVTIASSPQNAPSVSLHAGSSVDTRVIPGVFTDRTVITGRVFLDVAGSGYFERVDVGLARVRVFLEDGESVVTDLDGRYSFPGVRPGMHVLRLDSATLPKNARPYAERDFESQKSTRRLVHGVFDGGIIEDINFALEAMR